MAEAARIAGERITLLISANRMAYMLSKDGYTIAHHNIDNVKNRENTSVDANTDSSLKGLAKLEQKMTAGESGFGKYTYGGVSKFLAYAPIGGTDGWSIGLNAPISDFMDATINSIIKTIILLVVSILTAAFIAFRLSSRIGKAIKTCADRLVLLSQGDLHSPVESGAKEFYIGDFAPISVSMHEIIDRLTSTIPQINQASGQASSIEELAATVNEISSYVGRNAESAKEASHKVDNVGVEIALSNQKMQEMIVAMGEISNS